MLRVALLCNMQHYPEEVLGELNGLLDELGAGLVATVDGGEVVFDLGEDLVRLEVHRRVGVTPATALRFMDDDSAPGFVVGDIVQSQAAEILAQGGWSFWDRRGRLRIWLPDEGFRLDVDGLRSFVTGASGPDPVNPVVGAGSIAVALALLTADEPKGVGVREIARAAGMNPSTISRARSKLVEAALVDPSGAPLLGELFWATSRAWRPTTVTVDQAPTGEGWVLGGDSAAASQGASVFGERSRWYTLDNAALRRWSARHQNDAGSHEVALAPTPLVIATAADGIVHPVVAALDLSTTSRGREILMSWATTPVGKPAWI